MKRVVEFCASDFYLLLGFSLWASLLITALVIRPITNKSKSEMYFDLFSKAWVAFALTKSGIPEILFPVISTQLVYIRFANFFSSIAHLGPPVAGLSQEFRWNSRLRRFAAWLTRPVRRDLPVLNLHVLVAIICLSPYFAKWLGVMVLISFAISIVVGTLPKRGYFLFFGICSLLEAGKLFNLRGMPYGSTTLTFIALLLFDQFLAHIRHSSKISNLLIWAKASASVKAENRIESLLREVGERFSIRRLTVIEPQREGHCRITIVKKESSGAWKTDSFYHDSLPTVFSHVLTTREAVWNIHEESDLAANLRKGNARLEQREGSFFTVVPIVKDLNPVGALAFTGYSEGLFENGFTRDEIKLGVQLLLPMLADTIWSQSLSTSDEWYRKCVEASEAISGIGDLGASEKTLEKVAAKIFQCTGLSVFLSRVNPLSRELDLKFTAGFSNSVSAMYQETRFYALVGNTQGPMPLAVNRGKIVTVSDLTWLYTVLHPFSLRILKESECRSAAAVPVFLNHVSQPNQKEGQKVWGLLWLESKQLGEFSPNKEPGLRILAAAIESVVSRLDFASRARGALEELVRADVAEKLLQQVPVREEESGYLLVADIRGSTKIANYAGAQAWLQFVGCLKGVLDDVGEKYGLMLQFIIWDAFYFTVSSEAQHDRAVPQFASFAREVNSILKYAFEIAFPESIAPPDGSRARFCLEFGDITRDVSNGSWTITGAAMASVSKLEAACKGLPGWFFLTEASLGNSVSGYEILRVRNPGTGARIVSSTGDLSAPELAPEIRERIADALRIMCGPGRKAA